jgi:hypothetical protein
MDKSTISMAIFNSSMEKVLPNGGWAWILLAWRWARCLAACAPRSRRCRFFYPRETGRSRRSYGDLMGIYGDLTHQPVVIQKWVDLSMANC